MTAVIATRYPDDVNRSPTMDAVEKNPADPSRNTAEPTDTEPTAADPTDTAAAPEIELPVSFRISKLAYFSVPPTLIVAVILAGASIAWLSWTLIIPVLLALWIHRLRTDITETGLHVVHTFGTQNLAWDSIEGLQFPKWSAVRAVLEDGSRVRLPAIAFRDLPLLSAASAGRIPNPYDK
ncbi:PH domain-containing protein [Gordonia amarae]|uniref:Low molecular weight protein antigen 6 PH domain-containing protein n=2 Tax=Gordonia amarae TaxID=36821 RepID=G7GK71_9ACTN|nr:hypothetical protein GOAMR_09_00430 [Gordonia amarae NBRC 15530]